MTYDPNTPNTPPPAAGGNPPNTTVYIVLSILQLICCCLPLGIAALVLSIMANSKIGQGDIVGAQANLRTAKILLIVGLVVGIIANIAAFSFGFFDAITEMNSTTETDSFDY